MAYMIIMTIIIDLFTTLAQNQKPVCSLKYNFHLYIYV